MAAHHEYMGSDVNLSFDQEKSLTSAFDATASDREGFIILTL